MCNLSEIVVRESDSLETLKKKAVVAAIIGTFQCTLTEFRYVRSIWKKNAEEERLLGVSMTGIMDHPVLNKVSDEAKRWLTELRAVVNETNAEWAEKLGIESSCATTTCKPSGCQSLNNTILTTSGVLSLREIFNLCEWKDSEIEKYSSFWIKDLPENLPRVFDENDDIQNITGLYINGIKDVYEIEFEDGQVYEFTGNHLLKTKDGMVRVDELSINDDIIIGNII